MIEDRRLRPINDDGLLQIVDELGEEILGLRWLVYRPFVVRWMDGNPERVFWIVRRVRSLVKRRVL